ncbi:MAG: hypothetical protein U0572_05010 [Phycisphaerales bacterium]
MLLAKAARGLCLVAACASTCCPLARADGPLDLSAWTLYSPENDWIKSNPTPTSLRMDENTSSSSVHPGWAISDVVLGSVATIEFSIGVASGTSDDDLIGLGFSYLDESHSYLLDWKRSTQSYNWGQSVLINDDVAEQGLKIKRIDGGYTWDGLWGGIDGMSVSTIAGPYVQAWAAGTTYHVVLQLSPGHIVVTLDGVEIFNIEDPSYPGAQGAIALYGFSQDNILLSEVYVTPLPSPCPADLDASGAVDAADLGVLLGGWGTGGATDLDANGSTDAADLAILLGAWGSC